MRKRTTRAFDRSGALRRCSCAALCRRRPATRISRQVEKGRYLATVADCVACHTDAERRQAVRRRPPDRNAVRQHHLAEHHARQRDRHRRLDRRAVRRCRAQGRAARRQPALSRRCRYTRLYEDVARRRRGDPRLSQHRRAGPPAGRGQHAAVSIQHPAGDAGVGRALFQPKANSSPIRRSSADWNRGAFLVEGPGPLHGLPHAEIISRRRQDAANICAAPICKAGSRPTSPRRSRRPRPVVAPTISRPISRPATTVSRPRPGRWPKRSSTPRPR